MGDKRGRERAWPPRGIMHCGSVGGSLSVAERVLLQPQKAGLTPWRSLKWQVGAPIEPVPPGVIVPYTAEQQVHPFHMEPASIFFFFYFYPVLLSLNTLSIFRPIVLRKKK